MKEADLFSGIRDANCHKGGIRCLQLFQVKEGFFGGLRAAVEDLVRDETPSDVRDALHVTNWTRPVGAVTQFSLLNTSGRYDDFSTDHNGLHNGKRFYGAAKYPYLAQFIEAFPEANNFRLNVIGPKARLSPHEEHSIFRTTKGSIAARVRFHLPIISNPHAELILDGWVFHLVPGTVYFVNHGCVHSARNGGERDRLHLVWDMLLTRNLFDCMFDSKSLPTWLARIPTIEQVPKRLRTERVGAFLSLPTLVQSQEDVFVDWFER